MHPSGTTSNVEYGRRGSPHRFTIRELLVLVAAESDQTDQRAYVDQIFGWYFNRTRDLLVAIVAAAVGLAIAVGGHEPDVRVVAVIAGLEGILIGSYFWSRRSLKPLHREYLCCLILLQRLGRFRAPLRAVFEKVDGQPWPEPGTYLPWYGSLVGGGRRLAAKVRERDTSCRTTLGDNPTPSMAGHYLFDVLAHVPTDEYERRRPLRVAVDEIIREAARIRAPVTLPIVTERLKLRPYTAADIPQIHAVLYGDAQARRLTGGVSNIAETRATIEGYIERQALDGYSFWVVLERETGEIVGEAGLKPFEDGGRDVELGYAFGPAFWGRGYATEVGRAILNEAFGPLGLECVVAVTSEENSRSQRVLAKLGFVRAGWRDVYEGNLLYFVLERG